MNRELIRKSLRTYAYSASHAAEEACLNTIEAELEREQLEILESLSFLYDKWENGTSCYEDPEEFYGYLGSAFRLSEEEEDKILRIIKYHEYTSEISGEEENRE